MSWNGNPSDINQTFVIGPTTGGGPFLSACTGVLTNFIQSCDGEVSLTLSGNTAIFSGDTYFLGNTSADTISGGTFFSGGTNLTEVIQDNFIQLLISGNTSGTCTNDFYVANIYGCSDITLHNDIIPNVDATVNLGTTLKRFRDINTVSGTSTVWISTISVTTPMLDLGLDSLGNSRIITADSSIIRYDILDDGTY
jgi:hypothetical protein